MTHLTQVTHCSGEVIGADEHTVNTGDGTNGVKVAQTFEGFDLYDQAQTFGNLVEVVVSGIPACTALKPGADPA